MTKTAIITGITGQDGAYLAEFLLGIVEGGGEGRFDSVVAGIAGALRISLRAEVIEPAAHGAKLAVHVVDQIPQFVRFLTVLGSFGPLGRLNTASA